MRGRCANQIMVGILLTCSLTVIGHEKVEGCTIGVASSKATADGRPLMWKNSDSSYEPKEVVYFKNGRFKYLAVVPAGDSRWVAAGVNEFGFCIVNAMAFNLPDESKTGVDGNAMMKWALQQCVTADDFESLLKQTNVSGRTTRQHLGVIDAFGGAAIFETGKFSYTRFDATDPKVAPQGYIVRANFAFTGNTGGDFGRARYDRANQLWRQAVEKVQLDYRYVLRKVCRDLYGAEGVTYTSPEMKVAEDNTLQVLNNQNAISRPNTRWVALFHGVRPCENPSLTTFWAIIGGPIFSIAVPSWVIAESTAPEMDGEQFSLVCRAARDLYLANYVMGDKRTLLLNPEMLPDIWAITYPAEDRIFDQTESIMTQWRQDYPTAQQVASFHQHMASEAMNTLQDATGMLMRKGGPMAHLRIALHMRSVEKAKAFIKGSININVSDGHGYTPLHYAVQNNQKKIIELLISENADVNAKNWSGQTPLNVAVNRGHQDIVELLLIKGADLNSADNAGNTSLHHAAQNGQRDIVGLLIDKGADLNAKNEKGQTPVDIALSRYRYTVARLLIAKGADADVSLHVAARIGALAKVKSLIEKVADINAKDTAGQTPLHHAVEYGRKDVVELLISNGANMNVKDKDGNVPVGIALRENNSAILELLIAKGANFDSIHLFAYQGDLDKVRSFIEKGTGANAMDCYGATPLHYAAMRGNKKVVELLVTWGAHVNAKDREGFAPVHFAAWEGYGDVVQVLIANSADVNIKNNSGRAPLWWANRRGHKEIIELLRKHGAKE